MEFGSLSPPIMFPAAMKLEANRNDDRNAIFDKEYLSPLSHPRQTNINRDTEGRFDFPWNVTSTYVVLHWHATPGNNTLSGG